MQMKFIALTSILAQTLLLSAPVQAGDVNAEMVSHPCAGCHGTLGVSKGAAPSIAGLPKQYFIDTMNAYKADARASTIMGRLARGYDDAQIEAMADFFSKQPWTAAAQDVDAGMVEKGAALHNQKFCSGCHGPTGTSPQANIPNLAGQYAGYLHGQMQDYADPNVAVPATAMAMRPMFSGLSDEDLHALAAFYASQK